MFLRTSYCVICTKADIQEKTEKEKELEQHQYRNNTMLVEKGTTDSLFLWVDKTDERKKIKENMESA